MKIIDNTFIIISTFLIVAPLFSVFIAKNNFTAICFFILFLGFLMHYVSRKTTANKTTKKLGYGPINMNYTGAPHRNNPRWQFVWEEKYYKENPPKSYYFLPDEDLYKKEYLKEIKEWKNEFNKNKNAFYFLSFLIAIIGIFLFLCYIALCGRLNIKIPLMCP